MMTEVGTDRNFLVVIRSSEERTLRVCRKLVENQAGPENIRIVQLNPFKRALEECFRIAIESGRKWLITVDADMLVLPGAIEILLDQAEAMPGNYLQLQGKIFDKITGTTRKAGPRIYRIGYLDKTLEYSLSRGDAIRPEGSLITALGSQGMPSRYLSIVTSYHDFEQYYKDLYRKAFVHANKHRNMVGDLIERCIANKKEDREYEVILRAVWDGLHETGTVSIDTERFRHRSEKVLHEMNLEEKTSIPESVSPDSLLQSIRKKNPVTHQNTIVIHDQPPAKKAIAGNLMKILKRDGIMRGSLHGLGILLTKAGNRLRIRQ